MSFEIPVMDHALEYKGILGEQVSVWGIILYIRKIVRSHLENWQLIFLSFISVII